MNAELRVERWIAWVAAPEGDLFYASGRDITGERAKEKPLAKAEEALRQAQKMEAIGQPTTRWKIRIQRAIST